MSSIENIRNFAIIAHIDHGKSTIADRIIHKCGGLTDREMKAQVLDSMDIERERGITIKAQTVKLNYKSKSGKEYILNIIDTPGHVDFSYEVSRSLYACEGSILIVDSTQGVEAQTLANVYQALDSNHEIIPILNKIDLPASDLDRSNKQIEDVIGIDTKNSYLNTKDEEVFKQKIITNFNDLFKDNPLVNKLTFDEKISIMRWRASQPSGLAVPLSLQSSRIYRIGFCGDWFEGEGFGRIEGSILSALILEKKIKDLIK